MNSVIGDISLVVKVIAVTPTYGTQKYKLEKWREINEDYLNRLKNNQVPESKSLEYKGGLHLDKKEDKKEFVADVTAFANQEGGHLFYGIEEDQGIPINIPGVISSDVDALILQMENILRDLTEPRLQTCKIEYVKLANANYVLVLNEWADKGMLSPDEGEKLIFAYGEIELEIINTIKTSFSFFKTNQIEPPVVYYLTFLDVKGYVIPSDHRRFSGVPIDREEIFLPDLLVESFEEHPDEIVKPWFDAIWNSFGFEYDLCFNNQGIWDQKLCDRRI